MTTNRYSFDKDGFANRLKYLRNIQNESQKATVEDLGITVGSLGHYETGKRIPPADVVYDLAKHYNVSADYLLGLREEDSPDPTIANICAYTGLSETAVVNMHSVKSLHYMIPSENAEINHNEKGAYISYPYISNLLSLSHDDDITQSVSYLESNIKRYCQTSKEMRELSKTLPEKRSLYYSIHDQLLDYYFRIPILSKYYELYEKKCKLISEDANIKDREKIEKELSQTAAKVAETLPSFDLDDFFEKFFNAREDYKNSENRLDQIKTNRARALMDILETLDFISK